MQRLVPSSEGKSQDLQQGKTSQGKKDMELFFVSLISHISPLSLALSHCSQAFDSCFRMWGKEDFESLLQVEKILALSLSFEKSKKNIKMQEASSFLEKV